MVVDNIKAWIRQNVWTKVEADARYYTQAAITTLLATHAALTATHGATGAVVGTTNSQTLTNKTLTSPAISGATSIWSELSTALAAKLDKTTGGWTTSGWTKAFVMSPGTILLWLKGATAQSRGIGYTTDGNLYVGRSTADDNSASATYDMVLDTAGNLELLNGTIATASGDDWDLAGYTGGAISADGYLTVVVNGTPYKIPVESA